MGETISSSRGNRRLAFVYDRTTFKQLRTFKYTGEGWGLTHNATQLIMSDGSASLRFLDPKTSLRRGACSSPTPASSFADLNELEWVNGEIYANIWQTDFRRADFALDRTGAWLDRLDAGCYLRGSARAAPTCSTALPTMQPGADCSSPASCGRSCSRFELNVIGNGHFSTPPSKRRLGLRQAFWKMNSDPIYGVTSNASTQTHDPCALALRLPVASIVIV